MDNLMGINFADHSRYFFLELSLFVKETKLRQNQLKSIFCQNCNLAPLTLYISKAIRFM